jgi:hypothetical protein
MLLVSATNGVYLVDPKAGSAERLLTRRSARKFYERSSQGFFGLCRHCPKGHFFVASRENLGSKKIEKKATDSKIINFNLEGKVLGTFEIKPSHDVHQICAYKDLLFLTDTGRNRVQIISAENGKLISNIVFGKIKADVNHINAVSFSEERLLVGLNNSGRAFSQIVFIPFEKINLSEFLLNGYDIGEFLSLPNVYHTHDLSLVNNKLWLSVSKSSSVYDVSEGANCLRLAGWVRGISQLHSGYVAIGSSVVAIRSKRDGEKNPGTIYIVDPATSEVVDRMVVDGVGQICDLVSVTDESE